MTRFLAMFFLVACAYPEEEFRDDLDAATCDWQADCYDYQHYNDCVAAAAAGRAPVSDSCTYDPDAAKECVDDYDAISCPDGEEHSAVVPEACTRVWSCD